MIIPVDLRRKYKIDIGDHIEFISIPDGILLKPSRIKQSGQSQTDELFGIFRSYAKRKSYPGKEKIEDYNSRRFEDLVTAGWDLIIVDEAHRLGGRGDKGTLW
ncbi:MAG: hypothetical protein K8S13_00365 [Desulfobacula sp.]|uniref:AbrB/MazE/SpoVT family DNA-binding domain-containing protein n=1 Tax=Desulfobacula sp. TaxID=2593537 RepID=UPI0025C1A03A|nr:hypothetical protein [Desulfobacula sp.]MCD4718302.1 hypothetical protein [Desulfobacula sp.]